MSEQTPAPLPEKDWWKSQSMWVAGLAMIASLAAQNGSFSEIAAYVGANKDSLVAWVFQGISIWGAIAALRRKTTLKIGK